MYISPSMLKNKLYLFDKWLYKDRNSLLVLLLVVGSTFMINYKPTVFYGIGNSPDGSEKHCELKTYFLLDLKSDQRKLLLVCRKKD